MWQNFRCSYENPGESMYKFWNYKHILANKLTALCSQLVFEQYPIFYCLFHTNNVTLKKIKNF